MYFPLLNLDAYVSRRDNLRLERDDGIDRGTHSPLKHDFTVLTISCIHTTRAYESPAPAYTAYARLTSSHRSPANACEHGLGWPLGWRASSWRLLADRPIPRARSTSAAIQLHTECLYTSTRAPCPVLGLVSFFDQPSIRDHSWKFLMQRCAQPLQACV